MAYFKSDIYCFNSYFSYLRYGTSAKMACFSSKALVSNSTYSSFLLSFYEMLIISSCFTASLSTLRVRSAMVRFSMLISCFIFFICNISASVSAFLCKRVAFSSVCLVFYSSSPVTYARSFSMVSSFYLSYY